MVPPGVVCLAVTDSGGVTASKAAYFNIAASRASTSSAVMSCYVTLWSHAVGAGSSSHVVFDQAGQHFGEREAVEIVFVYQTQRAEFLQLQLAGTV
jgi:hypothetical protein